jgi:polysaccharide export outer membrane protein
MKKTVTPTIVIMAALAIVTVHVMSNRGSQRAQPASATPPAIAEAGFGGRASNCPTCVTPMPNNDQQPCLIGVDGSSRPGEPRWNDAHPISFQPFLHGEYIGPIRQPDVDDYRLRSGDSIQLVYRYTREIMPNAYRINVGDELEIESVEHVDKDKEEPMITKALVLQDGTIFMPLVESVPAAGLTISELNQELVKLYVGRFLIDPSFMIRPVKVDSRISELRSAVDRRQGVGGQGLTVTVSPDGTIQVVGLGDVWAQGLTKTELKHEINARYVQQKFLGMDVEPILVTPAPRTAFVLGQVATPGQITLTKPITVMQAIAMSGGDLLGGNLRQVIVMRRTEDWQLIATKLDLRGAFLGKRPKPSDDIWVRDSDIILIPKQPIQVADDIINLVFTRGIYGVVPNQGFSFNFAKASTL